MTGQSEICEVKKMTMKKSILTVFMAACVCLSVGVANNVEAGTVNGKITKIRVYDSSTNRVNFQSRVPNVEITTTKGDILKAMLKPGKTRTMVKVERNGIFDDGGRLVSAVLDRVGDGLYIKTSRVTMFVSEDRKSVV